MHGTSTARSGGVGSADEAELKKLLVGLTALLGGRCHRRDHLDKQRHGHLRLALTPKQSGQAQVGLGQQIKGLATLVVHLAGDACIKAAEGTGNAAIEANEVAAGGSGFVVEAAGLAEVASRHGGVPPGQQRLDRIRIEGARGGRRLGRFALGARDWSDERQGQADQGGGQGQGTEAPGGKGTGRGRGKGPGHGVGAWEPELYGDPNGLPTAIRAACSADCIALIRV